MSKLLSSAVVALFLSTGLVLAAEPIKDQEVCQSRLTTHTNMLAESDSGDKANAMVAELLKVFEHLCQTEAYDEALLIGNTIRGLLASEN